MLETQQPVEIDLNESADELFACDAWCAQEKLDGRRCVVFSSGGNLRAQTRNGNPQKLPAKAVAMMPLLDFTVDGELVGDDFTAFDILTLGGDDVRALPYSQRLDLLASLKIPMVETHCGEAAKRALHLAVKRRGGEGIVFKVHSDIYREGRTANQVKLKNWRSDTFEVVAHHNGRMVLAKHGTEAHRAVGMLPVGTLVEIQFLERTKKGLLRHPMIKGIRDDLMPTWQQSSPS